MSIDMTLQKWAIFIIGVYGEISHFLPDPIENLYEMYSTRVDASIDLEKEKPDYEKCE